MTPRTLLLRAPATAAVFALLIVPVFAADKKKPPAPAVSITQGKDRLRIELGGELFTEYIYRGEERFFPVFYPVMGPGAVPMTRRFPLETSEGEDTDHPHHQSLWYAHSDINGENFWAVVARGDRVPGHTVHRRFKEIVSGEDGGHFIAENDYVAADGRTVLTDTRTVRFYPVTGPMAPRILDITITFHASHGRLVFADEKDAGMAIRLSPDLQVIRRTKIKGKTVPGKGHLLNSEGDRDGDNWGKRARWVDAYGSVGDQAVGVAIFDHPKNLRHPTWWHARTYGLITANAFGKHHFEKLKDDPKAGEFILAKGETVTFRWRFVFHRDGPEQANIEKQFKAFAED